MSNFFVYMVGNNLHPFLRFKGIFFWLVSAGGNWEKNLHLPKCLAAKIGPGLDYSTLTVL